MYFIGLFALFVTSCQALGPVSPGADILPDPGSQICARRNGYYKKEGSCDAFIECRDFRAAPMLCPDGLHFDPNVQWPAYPCGYPEDVPCLNRGVEQAPQPTAECPHQYGFYPSAAAGPAACGAYKMCVAGEAHEMSCPLGLAFNPATDRCDWPDLVPGCNAEEFLGFKCPAPPVGADGEPLDIVQNYKYEGECFYFFSCQQGQARLLSCDYGFAFDAISGQCVDADLVQCELPQAAPRTVVEQ